LATGAAAATWEVEVLRVLRDAVRAFALRLAATVEVDDRVDAVGRRVFFAGGAAVSAGCAAAAVGVGGVAIATC